MSTKKFGGTKPCRGRSPNTVLGCLNRR